MVLRKVVLAVASLLLLSSLRTALPDLATASNASPGRATIRHHDLFVQIDPDRHALVATDRMTIDVPQSQYALKFSLAPTLHLDRLVLAAGDKPGDESSHEIPFEIEHDAASVQAQYVTIPAAMVTSGAMTLTASYHGLINDPPKEPRHLRFVTPSETAGHIGSEGVYLSSESQWYLDLPESLSTHRLLLALPPGWAAVTQGKPRVAGPCPASLCSQAGFTMTEWDMIQPSEALTVTANRFVSKTRDWTSKSGQSVQLATYLFADDAHLADEYLDATARYLDAYIPLLGPYPFDTFAVVENFFASGLGMPTFTLLGSGVIKRHYVQPYALGHEIVHSWIGNAVFNRIDRGNWVEGLTTYLANYYWHELAGDHAQAREQRRLMLQGYNLHVPPARDYPVGEFTHKRDERDNAIGYQKAALVFHLLRQEVGEEAFWLALKRFVAHYRGSHAEWRDLERIFTETAGRDLRWFFAQWLEQDGAPDLTLKAAVARSVAGEAGSTFHLTATIVQAGRAFRVTVPFRIKMENGDEQTIQAQVIAAQETIAVTLPARPTEIELDPDAMVMRRIPRQALPPVLNHYVTDRRRSVVLAYSDPPGGSHPFREIIKRIESQDSQKPAEERSTTLPLAEGTLLPQEGSVLVLGSPESRAAIQSLLSAHCGDRLQLRDGGVTLSGTAYEGEGIAVLASCHRRDRPGSVMSLLYAQAPRAATTVARLLFFYGWNSYVVFKDGTAVARGEWETTHDRMEVSLDEQDVGR
jgi:hypothetical protein